MWHRKSKQTEDRRHGEQPGAPPALAGMAVPEAPLAAKASQDLIVRDIPMEESPPIPVPSDTEPAAARLGPWKMSLLLAGSAFCGGIAVVLWNRRLLTSMREVAPVARAPQQGRLWEDDS